MEGHGTAAGDPVKAGANAMPAGALDRWVRFMAAMARPGGAVILIHRAEALPEVLAALEGAFRRGRRAAHPPPRRRARVRVLVRAVKGSRAPLELRPGLVLHNADHSFRPQIEAILRHGEALPLRGISGRPGDIR